LVINLAVCLCTVLTDLNVKHSHIFPPSIRPLFYANGYPRWLSCVRHTHMHPGRMACARPSLGLSMAYMLSSFDTSAEYRSCAASNVLQQYIGRGDFALPGIELRSPVPASKLTGDDHMAAILTLLLGDFVDLACGYLMRTRSPPQTEADSQPHCPANFFRCRLCYQNPKY